jgi:hypothetical protein
MTGPTDGQGEYQGYPFIGHGSTGFPDAPAVLRSYFEHPALELLPIEVELDDDSDIVVRPATPAAGSRHALPRSQADTGTRYTGISYYTEAISEAVALASKHGIDETDARDGVLLYRLGSELEADLVVTAREWLLAERGRPHGKLLANLVSPEEAMAIIGLYLRWHQQPVIIGGALARWHPTSMRHSAAYIAMPAFERWNQAGRVWYDTTKADLTLENLNKTLLTRISRAFQFRDSNFALSTTMVDHEPEEMLCELDSLLFSLVGAFDTAARIVDLLLHLNGGRSIGWQYTSNKQWQTRLELPAKDLHDYTRDSSDMQATFQVLRWLRNSVHNEALDLTRDEGAFYITTETETQDKLRDFLRAGHPRWTTATLGAKVQPAGGATQGKWLPGTGRYSVTVRRTGAPRPADPLDGTLVFDVRPLVNKLFPACLSDLNAIMRLAPLTQIPGYRTTLDKPSRVNLPWRFSDTTGHRLRMLYGITELT